MEIGMLLDQLHRLAAVRRLQNDGVLHPFSQHTAQRITNERVIIDQQNFHAAQGKCGEHWLCKLHGQTSLGFFPHPGRPAVAWGQNSSCNVARVSMVVCELLHTNSLGSGGMSARGHEAKNSM